MGRGNHFIPGYRKISSLESTSWTPSRQLSVSICIILCHEEDLKLWIATCFFEHIIEIIISLPRDYFSRMFANSILRSCGTMISSSPTISPNLRIEWVVWGNSILRNNLTIRHSFKWWRFTWLVLIASLLKHPHDVQLLRLKPCIRKRFTSMLSPSSHQVKTWSE